MPALIYSGAIVAGVKMVQVTKILIAARRARKALHE